MAADEAGNIYGYKVNFMTAAGAAGVSGTDGLGLRMYKSILVGDDTMTSAVAAQAGDFYSVGGTLTMAEGATYTALTGSCLFRVPPTPSTSTVPPVPAQTS